MKTFQKLSRDEMKMVKGGKAVSQGCKTGSCSLYVEALKQTLTGSCDGNAVVGQGVTCWCAARGYQTNNGGSECVYAS